MACLQPVLAQEDIKPLVVIDLRPSEEKEGNGLLPLAGQVQQGRLPHRRRGHRPAQGGRAQVRSRPRPSATPAVARRFTVLDWSIYYNQQVQKSGGLLDSVGIQGYDMPAKDKSKKPGSICSQQGIRRRLVQGRRSSPAVLPADLGVHRHLCRQARHRAHGVFAARQARGKFQGDPGDTEALLDAIHKTSEAVIAAIFH